jgi:hypothetical protein
MKAIASKIASGKQESTSIRSINLINGKVDLVEEMRQKNGMRWWTNTVVDI